MCMTSCLEAQETDFQIYENKIQHSGSRRQVPASWYGNEARKRGSDMANDPMNDPTP